ncbi:MAG: MOSC domain-containing protein [Bacteroidia bacterium]|nr:MOSC domain-containing protein [Bacteroidia bacterium]
MNERRISEIWIYPIKSLAGIRLQKAAVQQKGLQHDRRWMLVDEKGRFLTQREHPEMALFSVNIDNNHLVVGRQTTANGLPPSIRIELHREHSVNSLKVQIWDDQVDAVEVDPAYSAWFSDKINIDCRLVFFPEKSRRDVDSNYVVNNEQVSLADGYPFLIIGQSSLDGLNKKLADPVTIKRFRPNFVFTGGLPHEEDTWKNLKVGSVTFEGVKPCSRCVLTTVNPETAEKGVEPLRTLSTYRNVNGKVCFGENLVARSSGEVYEGDLIEMIDFKNQQL